MPPSGGRFGVPALEQTTVPRFWRGLAGSTRGRLFESLLLDLLKLEYARDAEPM